MTSLDDEMVPAAKEIIDEFGVTISFSVEDSESYDPTTGATTRATTPTDVVCSPLLAYKDSYVDGKVIQKGDMRLIVPSSGLTFVPTLSMTLSYAGVTWKVLAVKPVYSGDSVAIYILQLRK